MHAAKTALGPVSVPQVLCALGAGLWLSEYVQLGFVYTYSISGASGDLRWLSIPLALPLALAVIFVLGRRHAPLSDRGGKAAAVLTMVVIACFVVNYPYSRDVYYASQYAEGMLLSWSLTFAMVFFGTFVAGEWLRLATRFMGGFGLGAVLVALFALLALDLFFSYFPGPAHFALQTGSMLASAVLIFFVGKAQREGKGGQPGLSGHREAPRLDPVLEELSETYALSKLALGAWIPAEADSRGPVRVVRHRAQPHQPHLRQDGRAFLRRVHGHGRAGQRRVLRGWRGFAPVMAFPWPAA